MIEGIIKLEGQQVPLASLMNQLSELSLVLGI